MGGYEVVGIAVVGLAVGWEDVGRLVIFPAFGRIMGLFAFGFLGR